MINNNSKIERMGFISKHTTNFPKTTPPYNYYTRILR